MPMRSINIWMAYISKLNIVNFKSHQNFKKNLKNNNNIVVIGPNGSGNKLNRVAKFFFPVPKVLEEKN